MITFLQVFFYDDFMKKIRYLCHKGLVRLRNYSFICMKKLMLHAITRILSVELCISILAVPQKRMPDTAQVCTDLVSAPCDQFHLQKGHLPIAAKRMISSLDRHGILRLLPAYRYLIRFLILMQIPLNMVVLLNTPLHQAKIILVKCSVMENP